MEYEEGYKEKIIHALSLTETVDDLLYIRERIQITDSINRRTIAGRELTEELLELVNQRYTYLVNKKNCLPF